MRDSAYAEPTRAVELPDGTSRVDDAAAAATAPEVAPKGVTRVRIEIFAGIMFWSWLWGVPGMLLAIPMMVVAKAVCDRIEGLQPIGNMLGE